MRRLQVNSICLTVAKGPQRINAKSPAHILLAPPPILHEEGCNSGGTWRHTPAREGQRECVGVCEHCRRGRQDVIAEWEGVMMQASCRAGRNYERWLLCMTWAGTRRRWWWPQGDCGGFPVTGQRSGPPEANAPGAA